MQVATVRGNAVYKVTGTSHTSRFIASGVCCFTESHIILPRGLQERSPRVLYCAGLSRAAGRMKCWIRLALIWQGNALQIHQPAEEGAGPQ